MLTMRRPVLGVNEGCEDGLSDGAGLPVAFGVAVARGLIVGDKVPAGEGSGVTAGDGVAESGELATGVGGEPDACVDWVGTELGTIVPTATCPMPVIWPELNTWTVHAASRAALAPHRIRY